MAEVLQDSPYANKLPRPYNQVQEGLGYSRHYAQRIRDMGKSSKDTWIKKLWNHMFQAKKHNSSNVGSSRREKSDYYGGQDTFRSRSRQTNSQDTVKAYSSTPTGRKPRREDGRKSRGSENLMKRGKTMDDLPASKKESTNQTPSLPPIVPGSPMVAQKHDNQKFAKTKSGPSAAFIQSAQSAPLYEDSDDSDLDIPPTRSKDKGGANEEDSFKSKSVKRNSFFKDAGPAPPPPRAQQSSYPKTTKSAEQRYEHNRSSGRGSYTASTGTSGTAPSHNKSEYKVVVQGRETKIESRKNSHDKEGKYYSTSRYDRKLKRIQDTYDGNKYMKSQKSHPFLSSQNFLREREAEEKKSHFRSPQSLELEKKAKAIVEKATKEGKVFSCEAPYPVDTYVRISLRKRGWVEKFGPKANNASNRTGASGKVDTETEEDFDAICGQYAPLPWEEEYGLHAVCSRLIRHCPAKFIWGGKSVNNMVLRSEVVTNHFPKARYFSSKTGLTSSLRELVWINSGDSSSFFPRCYTLCSDEMDDIIEDFQLTACMSLLKWVLKMYISKKHRDKFRDMLVRRENTKYEEVKFDCSGEEDNVIVEEPEPVIKEAEEEQASADEAEKADQEDDNSEDWEDEDEETNNNSKHKSQKRRPRRKSAHKSKAGKVVATRNKKSSAVKAPPAINFDYFDEDYESDFEEQEKEEDDVEVDDVEGDSDGDVEMTPVDGRSNEVKKEDTNKKYEKSELNPKGDPKSKETPRQQAQPPKKNNNRGGQNTKKGNSKSGHSPLTALAKASPLSRSNTSLIPKPPQPPKTPYLPNIKPNMPSRANTMPNISVSKKPVLPDLKKAEKVKKGGEVPIKAVDWAIYVLDKYVRSKNHDDLDSKNKNLTSTQWSQLLKWYNQVAHENYTVPNMTEGKLKESDAVLKKMKKLWPQYDIDGKRNMWIVKPGDKSKGIGIEFVSKLEDLLKYINNATMAGTYIMQKYIERPLLICNCKFDLRQWFIVTDWNPMTVWFYKECYLRICSQQYTVDNFHEAVHLSNVSVQQNYRNGKRDSKLPDNNFMTSTQFVKYLDEEGKGYAWNKVTYPGMKEAVISVLLATSDIAETRKNAFELYGADFILTEDYRPYLLEINCSPGMAPSSVEKAKLCAAVMDDTIKVVLDKRENKNADTGGFELIYKDTTIPQSKCVDTKFLVEGQRIKKGDLSRYNQIDQNESKKMKELETNKEAPTNQNQRGKDETNSHNNSSNETNNNQKQSETTANVFEQQQATDTTINSNQHNQRQQENNPYKIDIEALVAEDVESVDSFNWQAESQSLTKGENADKNNNNEKDKSTKTSSASNENRHNQQQALLRHRRIVSPSSKSVRNRTQMISFRNANKAAAFNSNTNIVPGSATNRKSSDKAEIPLYRSSKRNAQVNEERIRQKEKIYSTLRT